MKKYRFLFTGGGTGGHVYPNIAIYEALKKKYPDAEFLYVGTRKGSEASIVPALSQPMEFIPVPARGLPQKVKSLKTIPALGAICCGAVKSFFILRRFKPDIIIGSGGYASAPVLLAAALLKIKVFIHEQNAVPGRLNLFVARFATRIGVAFASTASFFPATKVVTTGYPLRKTIQAGSAGNSRDKFAIPPQSRVLLICSGSMGARTINRAAAAIIPRLLTIPDLFVIMSTGKCYNREYKAYDDTVKLLEKNGCPPEIAGRLLIREYFDPIAEIYSMADLAVSRAGAGTIKELTAMGLPAILVPKLNLPGDHQVLNARELEKIGAARILYEEVTGQGKASESALEAEAFFNAIAELLDAPDQRSAMRRNLLATDMPDSTATILNAVKNIIEENAQPTEREIQVFYLQALEEEKNIELPFPTTSVGNTFFSDIPLEDSGAAVSFEIHFPPDKEFPALIRRRQGRLLLNDQEMSRWTPLRFDDRIQAGGRSYIFKGYVERTKENSIEIRGDADGSHSFFAAGAARVAGFAKEIVAAALFGAGKAVDIFSALLTLAGFLSRCTGNTVMNRTFLPLFSRLFQRGPRKKAWETIAPLLTFMILFSLLLTVAAMLLAPWLIHSLFPGLAVKGLAAESGRLARILFPVIFLGTLSAAMTALLNVFQRPAAGDAARLLFAVAVAAGILLFLPGNGFYALGYGMLSGAVLQTLFLLPFLLGLIRRSELGLSFSQFFKTNPVAARKYATTLAPASFAASLTHAPEMVEKFFASFLRSGSLSFLYFAAEILRLPFIFISHVIQRRVFTEFNAAHSRPQGQQTKKAFIDGIQVSLFLLAPVSILLFTLAQPIVSLLLERAHFGPTAVAGTARALQFYAIGLSGLGIHALTRRFFALSLETRVSTKLDLLLLAMQIPLVMVLAHSPLGFAGIALATSISYLTLALIRIAVIQRQLGRDGIPVSGGDIFSSAGKTFLACLLMVIAIIEAHFIFKRITIHSPTIKNIIACISLSFIGTAVYFLSSLIFKNTSILIFKKKGANGRRRIPVSLLSPFKFLETVSINPDFYKVEFRYKTNLYLSNPNWEVQNIGIKLIGLFKEKSKSAYLLDMLAKGRGNPFMRRNALLALKSINPWNEVIKELLLRLLHDNYFEVRAAALDYLGQNISESEYHDVRQTVQQRLRRGCSQEKIACLRLIARKGNLDDLPRLQRFYLDSNSLLREEVLELLYAFYRRHLLKGEEVKTHAQQVLITSNHLTPEFKIKSIINRIYREIDTP
jgi:undecaprenyldiphospho-muramoylpentapeptide beta-N-acetylglucosaminyltransferase/murein biosynthesis integral membrane protein MurJ